MSARSLVYIATSLDGFIARSDGDLDWLDAAGSRVPEGEDLGYAAFMATVDVLVMGRKSFEKVLSFGQWPYGECKVVVLSRTGVAIPEALQPTVSTSSESPDDLVARLSTEGAQRLYIDGGQTIQRFLRAGLISELIITVIPVLLGSGISLFGPLEADIVLDHVSTEVYPFGFVQHRYRPAPVGG